MGDDPEQKKEQKEEVSLAGGPKEERGCTDIICCIIFIAYMIFMVVLGIEGIASGEPYRLVAVYDSSWFPCGLDTTTNSTYGDVNLADYKYVYFPIPHPDHLNKTVCVKECPNYTEGNEPTSLDCNLYNQTGVGGQFKEQAGNDMKCNAACSPFSAASSGASSTQGWSITPTINWQNLFCIYNTTTMMNRICFPGAEIFGFVEGLAGGLSSSINMDQLTSWMNDVDKGKDIIYASFGIVFVLGFLYMLFVRIFSGVIVWFIIILFFILLAALGISIYRKYEDINDQYIANGSVDEGEITADSRDTYLYCSYAVGIIWLICLIGLFCMWNNIRLAIAVIKTATIFMKDVPTCMLIPPVLALCSIVWLIVWLIFFVHVYAVGDVVKRSASSVFATVIHSDVQGYKVWAFIFGGLWVNAFFQALTQFLLASSVSIWYWSQPDTAHSPVRRSVYRAFRYHLGSLAFGSFILAIVQTIRIMLEYVNKQMEAAGADKNKFMKYLMRCLRCCMACFERFIKFLNKNAYIQVALVGTNFCVSAKNGMQIVWANAARVALVSGLGAAFIFIGKVFMIVANVYICYLIYINAEPYKTEMTSTFLPLVVIFVISWGVATIFLTVYGMSIDTILMCFLHDEKEHKGSDKKMRAPETLASFFADHDAKVEDNQRRQKAKEEREAAKATQATK